MRPLRSVPTPATAPSAPFATYAVGQDGSSWDVNSRFEQLLGCGSLGCLTGASLSRDPAVQAQRTS
jgi:hypothetical protein